MPSRSIRHAIGIAAGLLLSCTVAGSALLLGRMQHAARDGAEDVAQRTSAMVESAVNRLFLQVDGTLASLPALMEQIAASGRLDAAAASRALRSVGFQNLNFRDLLLVQADGMVWAAAQPASVGRVLPVDVGELRAAPRSGAVAIAGPVWNPTTGEWALFFARPAAVPGRAASYAVAEVPVPLVTALLAATAEMPGLSISVERTGGQLLAISPHNEARIGRQIDPPVESIPANRVSEMPDRFDPAPGLVLTAVRPTLYRMIHVAVSFDQAVAMAEWTADRERVIAFAVGTSLVIIVLATSLIVMLRQRERTEAERLRARATLESAIDSMTDGFVMFDANDRLVVCNKRYREMYAVSEPILRPGLSFEELIRGGCRLGQYPEAGDDIESFTRSIVDWHRGDHPPMERLLPDGRWLLITERHMPDGGTVGIRTDITALKRAMRELALGERRYKALARAGAVVTWHAAADGAIIEAPGWEALTGQPEQALRDDTWLTAVHPEDRGRLAQGWVAACSGSIDTEFRILAAGDWRWVRIRGVPVHEPPSTEPVEWVGTIHDVHERRVAENALAESEARFARAIAAVGMGTWDWDLATDVLHLSTGYEALYGQPRGALATARAAAALIHPEDRPGSSGAIEHALNGANGGSYDIEFRIVRPDGALRWLRTQGKAAPGQDGRAVRISGVTQDVTAKRQVELQLEHMARHDALTGLPNRLLLRQRMDDAVARARLGEPCAILCLDLDRFKHVNDTLGHPVGDALLRAVTERLLGCVRRTDTVARLGGDEFAVVQMAVEQPDEAIALAQRIVDEVGKPYDIEGSRIVVGASVGVVLVPRDGLDPDQLLRKADLALYRAKAGGRGTLRLFKPEMSSRMQERHRLEHDLRRAVAEQEFSVFYQPIVNVRTRRVSGFEALLRWQHPERGLVSPNAFINLAEELGLISPIGNLVLNLACKEAARWPDDVRVAVNLSPSQFAGGRLAETVARTLKLTGLRPARLELEITEAVLLRDSDEVRETLEALQRLGVGLAMDDFGTGYSSLSYLQRFPFGKVKIDRSFVQDLGHDRDGGAIVSAILALCGTLGMTTTAEGVETEEQLAWLASAGCTEAQGYLFSPPRPAADVSALLRMPLLSAT